jgi:hypothetical protein
MLALAFAGCDGVFVDIIEDVVKDILDGKDPVKVKKVKFENVGANGGTDDEKTYSTTALTLVFDKAIDCITADDLTLTDTGETGAVKGDLTGECPAYTLGVSGITESGEVTVGVAKTGYTFTPASQPVTVYHGSDEPTPITFTLAADGDEDTATTALTLAFNPGIPGLALATGDEDGIKFNAGDTGAKAGSLATSDDGATYTLAVSGITKKANVSVTVNKPGYTFDGDPAKSVEVWPEPEQPGQDEPGQPEQEPEQPEQEPEQPGPEPELEEQEPEPEQPEEPEESGPIAFATGSNNAISRIQAARSAGTSSVTIELAAGDETVQFGQGSLSSAGLTLTTTNSPASVTINGGGRVVALTGSNKGFLITVKSGVTLTLKNITFKGLANNTAALIKVDGGKLILEDGAVITGNTNTKASDGNQGGGGVYVNTGNLIMSGGTISGNKAKYGGGVYLRLDTFTMSGGTISGNTATSTGGGVFSSGSGTFSKTGGIIYGKDGGANANTAKTASASISGSNINNNTY